MNTLMEVTDLRQGAPRSPRVRLLNYAILARMIDKCRASLSDTSGEYHFDCPMDNMLFGFKNVKSDEFKSYVAQGHSDQEIARWFDAAGTPTPLEKVRNWSDHMDEMRPYEDPEKREWFAGECGKLGLNPASTTLFEFLGADDAASFRK
jgi:hypothetical protein